MSDFVAMNGVYARYFSQPFPARTTIAVAARDAPELADQIDANIGEGSRFHQLHGYYAQGVGPETAVLPAQWLRARVRRWAKAACNAGDE
jgi:hypothetical protein